MIIPHVHLRFAEEVMTGLLAARIVVRGVVFSDESEPDDSDIELTKGFSVQVGVDYALLSRELNGHTVFVWPKTDSLPRLIAEIKRQGL